MDSRDRARFQFVECNFSPASRSTRARSVKSSVNWQKHAAGEYHRRARASRPVKDYASQRDVLQEKDDARTQKVSSIALPGSEGFADQGEVPQHTPLIRDAGLGQWDPFSSAIRADMPDYVVEMLFHGELAFSP